MIQANHLCRVYRRGTQEVAAVDRVSFRIEAGERVGILGRSGSGKTTLLNLVAGLDRATSGELIVDSVDLTACSNSRRDIFRQKSIGVVFQQFRLVQHRTAGQNVELPLAIAGIPRRERRRRVAECLDQVGLTSRSSHLPAELSGGEQQRVAVARAIANRPKILLADEPTGNLDSENAVQVMDLIREVASVEGATLVLITHDEQLAVEYSSRIIRMVDGSIQSDSRSPEVNA